MPCLSLVPDGAAVSLALPPVRKWICTGAGWCVLQVLADGRCAFHVVNAALQGYRSWQRLSVQSKVQRAKDTIIPLKRWLGEGFPSCILHNKELEGQS